MYLVASALAVAFQAAILNSLPAMVTSRFPRAHFKLQSFFGALSARHTYKRQSPVDYCRGHRTNRMAVGKFLAVGRRDVDFAIGKTIFHAQLFPKAFGGRACAATGRDE